VSRRSLVLAAVVSLVIAACGGGAAPDQGSSTAAPAATTATTVPATTAPATTLPPATSAGPTLRIAEDDLGAHLVDDAGRTVYLFLEDDGDRSSCYDGCAANWPPLPAGAVAGAGVDAGLIASTTRTDGTVQATYAGHPLYYFAGDRAPGDANGQGIKNAWYVVAADGSPIEASAGSRYDY